jgi:DHA2 family multidrug resistance protein-like MFS transporter
MSMVAVLAAIVLVVIDGTIANVALPTIARNLQISAALSVWVVTSYQMAIVIALLPCAAVAERIGYRRMFTSGVMVFIAASALCSLSPNAAMLIAVRFLQGTGGAALMASFAALLRSIYPADMMGRAIGWNALAVALSAAAGPAIGASILALSGWQWLFLINLPVGMLILLAARSLPDLPGRYRKIDPASVVLNCAAFAPLVVGADMLAVEPAAGVVLLMASAFSFAALVRREHDSDAPLIPLDMLRNKSFRSSIMASICCFSAQMAAFVALPFHLHQALGQSTTGTGMYMIPWPLAVASIAPVAGKLSDRMPTAWLCMIGGTILSCGLALLALWPASGGMGPFAGFTVLCGLGFGMFQTPNNRNMLMAVSRERSGAAGAMQSLARLVGQTAGTVVMAILFHFLLAGGAPRTGLGIAAALALAGGLISLSRAPATMPATK